MYTWAVGTSSAPGEFSGTACGGARDRRQAIRRILANARGYSIFGLRGFATIQQDKRKGVEGNPTWDVLKEVRKTLKEREKRAKKRLS